MAGVHLGTPEAPYANVVGPRLAGKYIPVPPHSRFVALTSSPPIIYTRPVYHEFQLFVLVYFLAGMRKYGANTRYMRVLIERMLVDDFIKESQIKRIIR